jgi:hypothetical protein
MMSWCHNVPITYMCYWCCVKLAKLTDKQSGSAWGRKCTSAGSNFLASITAAAEAAVLALAAAAASQHQHWQQQQLQRNHDRFDMSCEKVEFA